jgi:uncharacterized membrane protein (DUF373 family)
VEAEAMTDKRPIGRARRGQTASAFRTLEHGFYIAIALALAAAGAGLFVYVLYDFARTVAEEDFVQQILRLLDGLLLVFIVAELLHTVRAVIDENVLITEPFLIVGIVALIRRLIVISAEARDFIGGPSFGDLMLEMGILIGGILALGAAIFLLRHTEHSEPRPAHEPDVS